jgi:murein endopeptidase
VGAPESGKLIRGVRLPAEGRSYFTWDPVLKRSPDRDWRRWGTDEMVRTVLRVVRGFRRAHPGAPRVGVGDLSLPRGGYFGPEVGGGIGHATHQNGLNVDVYYPRLDRRERPPRSIDQIDMPLAQDLVDRFVGAGAAQIFVGPNTPLSGPAGVVSRLVNHDNHLHVLIAP